MPSLSRDISLISHEFRTNPSEKYPTETATGTKKKIEPSKFTTDLTFLLRFS